MAERLRLLRGGQFGADDAGKGRWELVAEAYATELAVKGSERTAKDAGYTLRRFVRDFRAPESLSPADIEFWVVRPTRLGKRPSAGYIRARLVYLRGLYRFAARIGLTDKSTNPAAEIVPPKRPEPKPRALEVSQLRLFLDALPESPVGLRIRTYMVFGVLTGARRTEIMELKGKNFRRRDDGTWWWETVVKGGRSRRRQLVPPAYEALDTMIRREARGSLRSLPPEAPVWSVKSITMWQAITRHGKKLGMHVYPHMTRHMAAMFRMEAGVDLETLREFLGHRSPTTTAIYVRKLVPEEDRTWRRVAKKLKV